MEYLFTQHAAFKMKYYGLSKQKVSGVIRRPDRVEKGIAGNNTIAVMQVVSPKMQGGKKVWKQEVWVMYQHQRAKNSQQATKSKQQSIDNSQQSESVGRKDIVEHLRGVLNKKFHQKESIKIISAWRYPGVSPKNNPIPEEILQEMMHAGCI